MPTSRINAYGDSVTASCGRPKVANPAETARSRSPSAPGILGSSWNHIDDKMYATKNATKISKNTRVSTRDDLPEPIKRLPRQLD